MPIVFREKVEQLGSFGVTGRVSLLHARLPGFTVMVRCSREETNNVSGAA
jgi:hypothetical protein